MKCERMISWWVFCYLGLLGVTVHAQESCLTPDNEGGNCIPLSQCQPMLQLLGSLKSPLSSQITRRLRSFNCGSDATEHKICCPSESISLVPAPKELFQNRINAPDVTTHENINLLPEMCGYFDSTKRIVHGNNSDLNEFPWMVLLQYHDKIRNKTKFSCGGTIINKNYILTAAHCITEREDIELKLAIVGEHSIKNETDCEKQGRKRIICNPPVQKLNIQKVIPHSQYNIRDKTRVNDIGLLRVDTINLDLVNAKPVCLPIGVARDFKFKNVMVTGWGVLNPWTGETADILQKVSLPIYNKTTCMQTYRDAGYPLANTQTCIGGDDKDSCGGDSGGPMLALTPIGEPGNVVYVQQGVVSFGPRLCADPEYPGVYTLVKFYMDWILDNLEE